MDASVLANVVGGPRGTEYRRAELEDAIPAAWLLPHRQVALNPGDERWLGQFSLVRVSLLIAGRLADSSVAFRDDGRLLWDSTTAVSPSPLQRIKVVGLRGKEWHVNLVIEVEQVQLWRLWL